MKKYKLTSETTGCDGFILYRIEALMDFSDVKTGDKGGFVQSENNLSQLGNAWVYGNAKVFDYAEVFGDANIRGDAKVCGDAYVFGKAEVFGNAKVCGNAWVYGNANVFGKAEVYGNAKVCGDAYVCGDAEVYKNSDYIVFKNWWSSGRYFTWTRSNNSWKVGCFYGNGEDLIKKAYADSEESGREYERVVRYVENILADELNK